MPDKIDIQNAYPLNASTKNMRTFIESVGTPMRRDTNGKLMKNRNNNNGDEIFRNVPNSKDQNAPILIIKDKAFLVKDKLTNKSNKELITMNFNNDTVLKINNIQLTDSVEKHILKHRDNWNNVRLRNNEVTFLPKYTADDAIVGLFILLEVPNDDENSIFEHVKNKYSPTLKSMLVKSKRLNKPLMLIINNRENRTTKIIPYPYNE